MSATVSIEDVAVGYGSTPVQSGIDVRIPQGEIFAVVGDSGSGKSTLLRTLIGLMPAQRGEILFDGATLEERMSTATCSPCSSRTGSRRRPRSRPIRATCRS